MPNPYGDGSFMWYWYDWWIPVIVGAVALIVMLAVFLTSDWKVYGTTIRTVVVLAFLATLPLAEERIGIGIGATKEGMAVLQILGAIGSAIAGLFHFLIRGRTRRKEAVPEVDAEAAAMGPEASAGTAAASSTGVGEPPAPGEAAGPGSTFQLAGEPGPAGPAPPDATPPPAWLVFQSGANAGQTIPLSGAMTQIGRSPENDVVVDDPSVSRRHVQISYAGGTFQLADAGSAGGTIVEGSPAQETIPLQSGTAIRVGKTELVFMQGESAEAAAPPSERGGAAETMVMETPAPSLMVWLAVTQGPAKGATCQVKTGETTIGRAEDNDLRLNDAGISRHHAVIRGEGEERMTILDLGSASGTEVSGQKLSGRKLSTTSVVRLGGTELMLVGVERDEEEAPAAGAADATLVAGGASDRKTGVLVVQKGPDAGKTFQLSEGDNVIGRENAEVTLSDPAVSRRHAVVRKGDDGYTIYDLGSRAGTMVDEEKLEGAGIKGGDVIRLGRSEIVVMQPASSG